MAEAAKLRPVVLVIMDGGGYRTDPTGNAIQGHTPNLETFWAKYPGTFLHTSGEKVGLPEGQMGNSEVGHMNLGAGFIVYQQLVKIDMEIRDGTFFERPPLVQAVEHAKKYGSALHLMGLLGPGGVHAHSSHLFALLKLAHDRGLPPDRVFIHAFTDGRDTAPTSGLRFMDDLTEELQKYGGQVATVSGRYYAMDRDNRWERVEKAYNALTLGLGNTAPTADTALAQSYASNVTDEFIVPTVITHNGAPTATVNDNDAIIFYNFRADRARELTKAFTYPDDKFGAFQLPDGKPAGFQRQRRPTNLYFATMTQYDKDFSVPYVFEPLDVVEPVARVVSEHGLKQMHLAETEKYAHVTFFFNGGRETPFEGEERILVPSPKVATYDLMPEMSAYPLTDKFLEMLATDKYEFIVINYANFDMVGHTGIYEAAVKAAGVVDECVGRLVKATLEKGGAIVITADHGNAEMMVDPTTGAPFTEHTKTPVQCFLITPDDSPYRNVALHGGILADVAPTLLQLLNLPAPSQMTARSLIK